MQRVCGLILLAVASLCYATSPPFPTPTPLDCNATDSEAGLVLDLINDAREEGFLFKPFRVVRAYRLQKPGGLSIFFLTVDVLETKCSVLSGISWRNCTEGSSFHETVFGRCKAVTFISRTQRILKVLHYNCTLSPVPAAVIVSMCPDCPTFGGEITAAHIAMADKLVQKYNKESNNTNYFKTYHVERQSSQWVFGPSNFIKLTIKETVCPKTQEDVVLSNCKFLPDKDADLGFCKGNIYTHPLEGEKSFVSCELYGPKDDDDDDHHHGHGGCLQGKEKTKPQDGHSEVSPPQNNEPSENQGADHKPERSHKHHRHGCRPHHHHHHHPHQHGHHDHHHDHPHHHHHHSHDHVKGQNHTSSEKHGSSSEEHTDKKHRHFNKPKGSVEIIILNKDDVLPEPSIAHRIPDKDHPRVYEFPDSKSPLATCPGEPTEKLPLILKYFPHEVHEVEQIPNQQYN